ncbi:MULTISPECIES: hypothetical protein [unclassified Priestia]|uniref:hypothetical protein n=1 Tax=unclassified Priestia TaxID=2800374 RepID=UPI00366F8F77
MSVTGIKKPLDTKTLTAFSHMNQKWAEGTNIEIFQLSSCSNTHVTFNLQPFWYQDALISKRFSTVNLFPLHITIVNVNHFNENGLDIKTNKQTKWTSYEYL